MYSNPVLTRGFAKTDDLPLWMTEEQKKIALSRCRLRLAFYLKMKKADGSIRPLPPVHVFKHAIQEKYNQGKPGIDLNTQMSKKISLSCSNLKFEQKYIIRMINAITFNSWRAHQAVSTSLPYLQKEAIGETVGIKKMRKKLSNSSYSFQDYKYHLAIDMLRTINYKRFYSQQRLVSLSSTVTQQSLIDTEVLDMIKKLKDDKILPVQRKRVDQTPELKKLRRYKSLAVPHEEVIIKNANCALCSKNSTHTKRNTTTGCGTCHTPLCRTKINNEVPRCFDLWHQTDNLKQCSELANARLARIRRSTSNTPRSKASKASAEKSAESRRLSTLRIREASSATAAVEEADITAVEEANITGNSDDTTLNDPATAVPETNNIGQIEEV